MYEFPRAAPVTVALRAHSGSVTVVAEPRDTIEVEIDPVTDNDSSRDAAARTRVALEDDTLVIEVPGTDGWRWRRGPKLRITARVPAGSALTGRSASADVRVDGVVAQVQLDVASADVSLAQATGDVRLDTASGDLRAGRIGGSLHVDSASGDLRLGDVDGDVTVKTASGDVRVDGIGGALRASTASGDLTVGSLRQGSSDVRTASGDVQIGIAAGAGVWLDLSTAAGRATSDLTPAGDSLPAEPTGSIELRVNTASGDIHVHRATERKAA